METIATLARFPLPDGCELHLTEGARGWHVTLWDVDARAAVVTHIHPTRADFIETLEAT